MTEFDWRLAYGCIVGVMLIIRFYYDIRQHGMYRLSRNYLRSDMGLIATVMMLIAATQFFVGVRFMPMDLTSPADELVRSLGLFLALVGAVLFTWSRSNRPTTWAGPLTPSSYTEIGITGPWRNPVSSRNELSRTS